MAPLHAPVPLALALAVCARASGQSLLPQPREVIVEVPRAAERAALEGWLAHEGYRVIEEVPALGLLLVALPEQESVARAVTRLGALPGVGFAEPNGMGEGGGSVPNDTFFAEQWHLDNRGVNGLAGADIEALRGWEFTRGSPGVIVAVLDTGLALENPEFGGRYLQGFDCVGNDDLPADNHGHGTFVSGILAANADNAFGLAGVDQRCTLLPVKVLNGQNLGTTANLIQGLVFAADAGADVVSMSLINYPASMGLRNALQYARDAGCVLVACAGNGGIGNADVSYPGRYGLTISVGATTSFDTRAFYSGTGASLDLVAPGDGVPATYPAALDTWVYFAGCSAATPVVSGIAALALAVDPTLTHDQVRALLVAGAEDQVGPPAEDTPGRDDQFGHGRVNLFRTLCGLDRGGPTILAPLVIPLECSVPNGLRGDDPLVLEALASVAAADDLDPEPVLAFVTPPFLELGVAVPVVFTSQDACGNSAELAVQVVVQDTRPPELELWLVRDALEQVDGLLHPSGLSLRVSDACDLAPTLELEVHSDEGQARARKSAAARDGHGNLWLRAERDEAGDGRVYLCVVRARDASGNEMTRAVTVVVPHDSGPASLALVRLEAGRARETWERTGAPPLGYSLLLVGRLPQGARKPLLPRSG